MATKVIHMTQAPEGFRTNPDYVYVGRPSRWGNPFRLSQQSRREEVIRVYRDYMNSLLTKDSPENIAALREELRGLKGKTLVCYCSPKACHGDVLAEIADSL